MEVGDGKVEEEEEEEGMVEEDQEAEVKVDYRAWKERERESMEVEMAWGSEEVQADLGLGELFQEAKEGGQVGRGGRAEGEGGVMEAIG